MDENQESSRGFLAEVYDHVVPYRERSDVEPYVELARRSGGPVLELGCGTGRILIPTARAGMRIVGMDNDNFMLDVCRRTLATEPPEVSERVRLVEGDMTAFDLGAEYALITTPFRSFQLITSVAGQLNCLDCVRRHLSDRGLFVLDLFNPSLRMLTREDRAEEWGDEPAFALPDRRRVLRRMRMAKRDHLEQVNDAELIYYVTHPDGRTERIVDAFRIRYLFRYEAEHLLARAGFRVEAVYGDMAGSPFGTDDPGELILHARKA